MIKDEHHNVGYIYAILSAVLFGASVPAAKYLSGEINSWLLAGLLYLGAGIGLLIILIIRYLILKKPNKEANLTIQNWLWLSLITLFGGIIGPVLLMIGLVKTNGASASLLLNLESVFTAVMAWIVFKEHTNKWLIFGMLLIVLGSVVLCWQKHLDFNNLIGSCFIACACFAWAIDNNITRKISATDPLQIVAVKSFVAGSTNVILALLFNAKLFITVKTISISIALGFISYGLSIVLFILGLRHIGTGRTSAYFSLAPFMGAILSILFLGETLSLQLVIAGILMGIGIWIHLLEYHIHEHSHEELIHEHIHRHDEHHQHAHSPNDPAGEPHSHTHTHTPLIHTHPHYPDIHHRHSH